MPITQSNPVDDSSPAWCAGRKVTETHKALLWQLLNDDPNCPSRLVLHAIAETQVQISVTLRAWSPRTVIRWESAPVRVATAVICLLSSGGWPNSLVRQDQMDVCPLARGVMLPLGRNSYPLHYRVAFASSILPCPHACRLPLRCAFPCGRRTGLPCSVAVTTNGGGALCPPVACVPMTRSGRVLGPAPVPLWPKPASTFGLFSMTMCIERAPGGALPSLLAPSPSRC